MDVMPSLMQDDDPVTVIKPSVGNAVGMLIIGLFLSLFLGLALGSLY